MTSTSVRMAIIKNPVDKMYWPGCGEKGALVHCWWVCDLAVPLWEVIQRGFLKKLKIELPFGPVIPLLGIYPKEMETLSARAVCTPMFITGLFTTAKTADSRSVRVTG